MITAWEKTTGYSIPITNRSFVFTEYINDAPVGVALLLMRSDKEASLGAAYVDPDFRNMGVWLKLLRKRVNWAKIHGFKTLICAPPEDWQQKVLRSQGWEEVNNGSTSWLKLELD